MIRKGGFSDWFREWVTSTNFNKKYSLIICLTGII